MKKGDIEKREDEQHMAVSPDLEMPPTGELGKKDPLGIEPGSPKREANALPVYNTGTVPLWFIPKHICATGSGLTSSRITRNPGLNLA